MNGNNLGRKARLGHAVICAGRVGGSDPFAVLLADDFIANDGSGITADLFTT